MAADDNTTLVKKAATGLAAALFTAAHIVKWGSATQGHVDDFLKLAKYLVSKVAD